MVQLRAVRGRADSIDDKLHPFIYSAQDASQYFLTFNGELSSQPFVLQYFSILRCFSDSHSQSFRPTYSVLKVKSGSSVQLSSPSGVVGVEDGILDGSIYAS